jgi:hypothetical protein
MATPSINTIMDNMQQLTMPDFICANHGSIRVLTPMTAAAREWRDEHLPDDAQSWGRGVVIEPRYWPDIQAGIQEAGLVIA